MKQRRELLFAYDVTDSNPNGDPDDDNRPRMDHEGYNIVTDVRLKRTVRDYWIDRHKDKTGEKGLHVLIQNRNPEELLSMGSRTFKILNINPADLTKGSIKEQSQKKMKATQRVLVEIPKKCLDVRTFGGAITAKGANASITGTVQFAIGRSLNKPTIHSQTITTVLPSDDSKTAGSFGEFHYIDYSLILFHGIASEISAERTNFSDADLQHFFEGVWNGTKAINTRSKVNHDPIFLISIVSKEKEFQIGGLQHSLKVVDEAVASRLKIKIDLSGLLKMLKKYKGQVAQVEILDSEKIAYLANGKQGSLKELLETTKIPVTKIEL